MTSHHCHLFVQLVTERGGSMQVSQDAVAELLGCSLGTARYAIYEARGRGFVAVENTQPNTYRLRRADNQVRCSSSDN